MLMLLYTYNARRKMDYETLYFELLEDVQNFEKSVQKQMEELISLNLYRRARMAMQENGNSEPENDAEQELLERLHRKSDR